MLAVAGYAQSLIFLVGLGAGMDFLFSNVYLDIERWLERYGPDTPRDKEVRQVGKYGKAERIVLDAYYEAKPCKVFYSC